MSTFASGRSLGKPEMARSWVVANALPCCDVSGSSGRQCSLDESRSVTVHSERAAKVRAAIAIVVGIAQDGIVLTGIHSRVYAEYKEVIEGGRKKADEHLEHLK